jgi:hypothetical protein
MPAILDVKTGKSLPDDHPTMRAMMRAWRAATRGEQEAFWRVTVKNSRNASDLALCRNLIRSLEAN